MSKCNRIEGTGKDCNFTHRYLIFCPCKDTIITTEHGIVFRAEDYVFSSAIDYCGGKGLLDIEMIE